MNTVDDKRLAEIDLLAAESKLAYLRKIAERMSAFPSIYAWVELIAAEQAVAQQEFEVERCKIYMRVWLNTRCPAPDCGRKAGHEGGHVSTRMD